MNVWIQTMLSIGTLIHLSLNFLFPHLAYGHTKPALAQVFEYDKGLKEEYMARKARLAALERAKAEAALRFHVITAYSSTVEETDSDPFTTAAGTQVRDGIVAMNTLPFGSKIMIPDLFGSKVFTVEDRMAPKNHHKVDIWFPSKQEAIQFGVKKARVLVIPHDIALTLEKPSA
jgi:3D (Asp-Asp-Asp) domain-containing protein